MSKDLVIAMLKRFGRGFVAGGVSSMLVFLSAGTPISDFKSMGNLAIPLFMAFLTGGLQAIDKLVRWQE